MPGETVYDSRSVANYLIEKAAERGGLDPLQIMKLVYISHGFTLAILDRPLLEDDVEAWQYGPVLRRVFRHLPRTRSNISQPISDHREQLDNDARAIVDSVYEQYGRLSGLALSSLTHQSGTPWKQTRDTYGKNAVIPQDTIQRHFKDLVAKWEKETQGARSNPNE